MGKSCMVRVLINRATELRRNGQAHAIRHPAFWGRLWRIFSNMRPV
jgi:hypothetical protein